MNQSFLFDKARWMKCFIGSQRVFASRSPLIHMHKHSRTEQNWHRTSVLFICCRAILSICFIYGFVFNHIIWSCRKTTYDILCWVYRHRATHHQFLPILRATHMCICIAENDDDDNVDDSSSSSMASQWWDMLPMQKFILLLVAWRLRQWHMEPHMGNEREIKNEIQQTQIKEFQSIHFHLSCFLDFIWNERVRGRACVCVCVQTLGSTKHDMQIRCSRFI